MTNNLFKQEELNKYSFWSDFENSLYHNLNFAKSAICNFLFLKTFKNIFEPLYFWTKNRNTDEQSTKFICLAVCLSFFPFVFVLNAAQERERCYTVGNLQRTFETSLWSNVCLPSNGYSLIFALVYYRVPYFSHFKLENTMKSIDKEQICDNTKIRYFKEWKTHWKAKKV